MVQQFHNFVMRLCEAIIYRNSMAEKFLVCNRIICLRLLIWMNVV